MGVLTIRSLLFWVYIGARGCLKLTKRCGGTCSTRRRRPCPARVQPAGAAKLCTSSYLRCQNNAPPAELPESFVPFPDPLVISSSSRTSGLRAPAPAKPSLETPARQSARCHPDNRVELQGGHIFRPRACDDEITRKLQKTLLMIEILRHKRYPETAPFAEGLGMQGHAGSTSSTVGPVVRGRAARGASGVSQLLQDPTMLKRGAPTAAPQS